jgi:hypothetical protein
VFVLENNFFAIGFIAKSRTAYAYDRKIVGQKTATVQIENGRDQFPFGQIAGGAKDDQNVIIRLFHVDSLGCLGCIWVKIDSKINEKMEYSEPTL